MASRGEYGGACFLSDCRSEQPATWLNHFSKRHYCPECAARLNRNKANQTNAMEMFGHELCTEVQNKNPAWTVKMDHELRQMYPEYPAKALMEHFKMSETNIRTRASRLGIYRKPKAKRWTEAENYRISVEATNYTEAQLANRLNVSAAVLRKQLRKLGVKPLSELGAAPIAAPKKEKPIRKVVKSGGISPGPNRKLKQMGKEYVITTNGMGQKVILLGKNTEIVVREGKDPKAVLQRFLDRDMGRKQSESFI